MTSSPLHSGADMTPANCVFCGSQGLTREHIYRKSYSTYAGTNRYYKIDTISGKTTPMAPHESVFNLTAKVVCKSCNSNWMNQLDQQVQPAVTAFFEGNQYACGAQMAKNIALWAAKTTVMRVFNGSPDRGVTNTDIKYLYDHREPPADWLIYVAHTSTAGSTNECSYSVNEVTDQTGHNATELPSGLLVPKTGMFLMQEHWWAVEEMLMIVFSFSGPPANPGKVSVTDYVRSQIENSRGSAPTLIQLWPKPQSFNWPADLTQGTIEQFMPILVARQAISDSLASTQD